MVGYITTDDLWRKWARDRGMTAPASTDVGELAQHYYRAADADAVASDELRVLLDSSMPTREQVSQANQAANEARGRLLLVEEAIERSGGWVDPYRPSTVVIDSHGQEVPRETLPSAIEVVLAVPRRSAAAALLQAAIVRPASALGW
jgi:hypothetical protein